MGLPIWMDGNAMDGDWTGWLQTRDAYLGLVLVLLALGLGLAIGRRRRARQHDRHAKVAPKPRRRTMRNQRRS